MKPFQRNPSTQPASYRRSPAVTIRWATSDDAGSLAMLAALDDAPVPPPPILLAFVGDELWSALSAGTGVVIADPFRPSADVAALLRERSRQLTVAESAHTGPTPLRLRARIQVPRVGREAS